MERKYKLLLTSIGVMAIAGAVFWLGKARRVEIKNITPEKTEGRAENAGGDNNTAREDVREKEAALSEPEVKEKTEEISQKSSEEKKESGASKLIDKLADWGFEKSEERKIDTVIIHSSYNALGGDPYDLEKLIKEYKSYGVAPHYLIDRNGNIYRLVEDKNIAYHAGESQLPDGRTNVNNFSIGIELMNTKKDKVTSAQKSALKDILETIKAKYNIKYVLCHKDIAPGRKDDPWNFDCGSDLGSVYH